MARRAPSQLRRAARATATGPAELACITGLSRRAHQCLLHADTDLLHPPAVKAALQSWTDVVTSATPLEPDYPRPMLPYRASDARTTLDAAERALPPALRPELTALVGPLDRLLLSRVTIEGHHAHWWQGLFLE